LEILATPFHKHPSIFNRPLKVPKETYLIDAAPAYTSELEYINCAIPFFNVKNANELTYEKNKNKNNPYIWLAIFSYRYVSATTHTIKFNAKETVCL
jgi:hypothetical protein